MFLGEVYQVLTIKGDGGSLKVKALVDTGANVNVVNYSVARKVFSKDFLDREFGGKLDFVHVTDDLKLSGVFVYGAVVIGGEERATSFFVTKEKVGADVLLGVVLLQQYEGYVDLIKDKLRFRKMSKRKGKWI